jgi:predicted site-specific integrase-resolvase
MSKVSMAEAAKLFEVSRPTLAKHLKEGKISGNHVFVNGAKVWQLDMAELKRVYQRRGESPAPALHDDLAATSQAKETELQAEIRVLQAKLEAAEKLAEERAKHLDDLRRLLPGPAQGAPDQGAKRRWWPWS